MKVVVYGEESQFSSSIVNVLNNGDEMVLGDKDKHMPDGTDVLALSQRHASNIKEIWKRLDPSISILAAFESPIELVEYMGSGNVFHIPYPNSSVMLKSAFEKIRMQKVLEKRLQKHIIGHSRDIKRLRAQIALSSQSKLPVHLYGETGTGKSMSSKLIHTLSGNKKEYVYINCSNLNSSIIDSDLFGPKKGAYTSAGESRKGLLGKADGTTLFLDEVGDLPLDTQGKLLDTIETGSYRPVGSDVEENTSFRLITAAQKSLEELLEEKKIRRDFYYRIKNISINTSPLRNHPEDIPDIIKAYEEKKNISEGRIKNDYTKLMGYKWNGNVRELYHFLDRIYAEEHRTLESERH